MRFSAIEVAAAVGGELDGLDVELTNVTIDSRAVEPGSLFVAVVAKRDGHVYVPHAVRQVAGEHSQAGADLEHDVSRGELGEPADHPEEVLVDEEMLAE